MNSDIPELNNLNNNLNEHLLLHLSHLNCSRGKIPPKNLHLKKFKKKNLNFCGLEVREEGFKNFKKFSMSSNYEEIKNEYERLKSKGTDKVLNFKEKC